jgi:hypothetical protein
MTREERAARQAQRLKDSITKQSQALAKITARQRAAAKHARAKRQLRWARILDHLGLLKLDDVALQEILTVAYHLVQEGRVHRAASPAAAAQEQRLLDTEVLVLTPPLTVPSDTAGAPSNDQGNKIAQLGISRDEQCEPGHDEESEHGAYRLHAHGL